MKDTGAARRTSGEAKALIVGNNPRRRRAMRLFLDKEENFIVRGVAHNGQQGIELARRLKPDVILMADDIQDLPSKEVAQRIKQQNPKARVIIVPVEESQRRETSPMGAGNKVTKQESVRKAPASSKKEYASMAPNALRPRDPKEERSSPMAWIWQAAGALTIFALLLSLLALPRVLLPVFALVCGLIFFGYGLKYYLSVAFILLATTNGNGNGNGRYNHNNRANGLRNGRGLNGLSPMNGTDVKMPRQPFVSIHLPLYNEATVVDRLLSACTSQQYNNYEIVVADDSTDETTDILHKRWGSHPRIKISHRESREGFKGGALQVALNRTDPKAEFIVVLDADFIPPPDLIKQFMTYFYDLNGNGSTPPGWDRSTEMPLVDEKVAVVQGYQWHILNASENWITSGIRTEFSGSYVVERSGQQIMGGMKMISGSVFMIRKDVLQKIGWKTSITEDWELTLRVYLNGYKVLYSPFIQAPAECVSEFQQLARQRMRWAEGHTFNVKKYFWRMLLSAQVSLREKLEFIYYAPYYLQSALFLLGTTAWLLSEVVLNVGLPYWSEFLGWSLVIVNSLSLPLMNLSGLFLERGVGRSWKGVLSFWLLSYLLAPYQAYAAIKGLLEPREGDWHRTQKSGVITEVVEKLTLRRHLKGLGKRKKKKRQIDLGRRLGASPSKIVRSIAPVVGRLTRRPGLGFRLASGMVVGLLLMWILSSQLPIASAAANVLYLRDTTTNGATPAGEDMNESTGSSEDTLVFDGTDDEAYWYTEDTFPEGGEDASIAAGSYKLNMYFDALPSGTGTAKVDDADHNTTVNGSSITISSFTVSGTNRLLVVGVSVNPQNDEYVTGVTWNSTETFIKVREDQYDNDARTEIWYLINPTATTSSVVVSFNDSLYYSAIAGVVSLTGVAQSSPVRDHDGGNWSPEDNPSVTATSAVGDMVFGVVCVEDADVNSTTADREHWRENEVGGPSSGTTSSGTTSDGDAGSTTIEWTFSAADHTAASIASFKPADASVDIQVTAYHTNSSGGDATEITTSSTIRIDSNTSDPYELDIGSGAAQTFEDSDPRRIRVHIDVIAVNGGSFTLAYDSAANSSNLTTPDFVVPGVSLLLLLVVIFIPIVMNLVMHKQRPVTRVMMIVASAIGVIAILTSSVAPAGAAANVLYLRDTTTNGATPAGEDMNEDPGSSENTLVFDGTDDEAYWYTEDIFPEAESDASIAAGSYTLNMYFDAFPAAPSTNYYETTVASFTTTETTCTNVTGGSLTFTPGATSEIWVILISARLGSSSTSQINTEACFTVNSVEKGMGGVQVYTSSSRASWQDFYRVTNTTAQQTVQVQLRHASGNTATIEDLKIIAFKMPADADFQYVEDTSTQDVTGGSWNSYEDLTFTPSSGGDYLIMAVANFSEGPGVSNIGVRVKDPSASYWPEDTNVGSDMLGHFESGRTTWYTAFAARVQTLTAAEKTYLIEGYGSDPEGSTIRYTRIMAFRTDAFDDDQSDEDLSQSSTTSTSPVVKSVVTTTAPPASRDYIVIQSLAMKASASSTEARQAGFEADDAVQTSYNHVTNNSATYVSGGYFDALTTSSSIKYENTYSTSDSGYTVNCKESVIHVLRLPASTSPSVSIQVSLYHTNSTGGDATEISTSSTIVIDSSTSDPYELDIGSGAAQTFEAVDPRRLRVHIDVTAVADGGSFTLAYDSDANKSNLVTPDFVVPGVSLLLLLVVIFIPIVMNLVMRKHRLVTRALMIVASVIGVIAILSTSVIPAGAAANLLYLRDTTTNGATPAGEDMNESKGSSENTMVFDGTDDEAYWYTEDLFPTGDEDASIAAGSYKLNMYFDALPSAGGGGIQVDDSDYNTTEGGSSITISSYTVSGTDRLMLVGVNINPEGDEYVTGITWNTTEDLTKVRHDVYGSGARTEIWYLKNPTATSANVVVSFDSSLQQSAIAGVVTFTGVDQTTPLGNDNGDNWADEQYPSVNVTTSVGDMVFGVVSMEWKDITATDADTEHWRVNDLGDETTGGGGTKAGAASSTSIGWSFDDHDQTAISAVAINPAATPSVDITVSVYHTNSTGGDATEITTSSTIVINNSTSDPYELDIGSGAAQTFQKADPRRIRVHVDVTAVAGGGSFTLAYDSAANSSNLTTPNFVVPGASLLLVLFVIFIPIIMNLVIRQRRLASHVGMIAASVIGVIAVLSSSVTPVGAAPEDFWLRDTTNNGASPAGEDMNTSTGSSENTLVFDGTDDDVYWYSESTYPTGDDNASIAAGTYTLRMYFNALPSGSGSTAVGTADHDTVVAGDTITISSFTVSGTNRLLVVGVSINPQNDEYVTGITWNSTETFDKVRHDVYDNDARTEIWYLINPTATTANVVVSFDTDLYYAAIAGVVSLTGVVQSSPVRDHDGGNWSPEDNPSVTATSAVGDMVFGVVSVEDKDVTSTTADREHWRENEVGGPSSGETGSGCTSDGVATSTTIEWTFTGGDHTAASIASFKPADASVDIQVSAYHTNSTGGDATEIVTSSSTNINGSTTDPYDLTIGSGSLQTFTSADPRRIRVLIDVIAVNGSASFTLAYDSAANPSYLELPTLTVPDQTLILVSVAILIPVLSGLSARKRRRSSRAPPKHGKGSRRKSVTHSDPIRKRSFSLRNWLRTTRRRD